MCSFLVILMATARTAKIFTFFSNFSVICSSKHNGLDALNHNVLNNQLGWGIVIKIRQSVCIILSEVIAVLLVVIQGSLLHREESIFFVVLITLLFTVTDAGKLA